jgi:hypothetical protein
MVAGDHPLTGSFGVETISRSTSAPDRLGTCIGKSTSATKRAPRDACTDGGGGRSSPRATPAGFARLYQHQTGSSSARIKLRPSSGDPAEVARQRKHSKSPARSLVAVRVKGRKREPGDVGRGIASAAIVVLNATVQPSTWTLAVVEEAVPPECVPGDGRAPARALTTAAPGDHVSALSVAKALGLSSESDDGAAPEQLSSDEESPQQNFAAGTAGTTLTVEVPAGSKAGDAVYIDIEGREVAIRDSRRAS